MKIKRILIFICLAFIACNKEFKPYTTEVKTIDTFYKANIEVNYDSFSGNSNAEVINSAIEKAMYKAIDISTTSETLESGLEAFDKEYQTFISDFPDTHQKWELIIETEVVYQSESVITVAINTYQDKGGAHGNDTITLLNFNPETGHELDLGDIVNNMPEFKKVAERHFYDNVKNNSNSENAEDYFFGEGFQLPNNIGFSEEGIILLYNVYEIASYSQGYTEFTIPYKEANAFLNI
ncbi:DUF3298 domain-containing protein [Winogradskyella sp. A3E31]|uniref:DUF3298 and DUF4163 domain-containing protein n=1 Tax=Winogradskyella sp. A3E31 TaxID=3349637 RepID=UPI00398B6F95